MDKLNMRAYICTYDVSYFFNEKKVYSLLTALGTNIHSNSNVKHKKKTQAIPLPEGCAPGQHKRLLTETHGYIPNKEKKKSQSTHVLITLLYVACS